MFKNICMFSCQLSIHVLCLFFHWVVLWFARDMQLIVFQFISLLILLFICRNICFIFSWLNLFYGFCTLYHFSLWDYLNSLPHFHLILFIVFLYLFSLIVSMDIIILFVSIFFCFTCFLPSFFLCCMSIFILVEFFFLELF